MSGEAGYGNKPQSQRHVRLREMFWGPVVTLIFVCVRFHLDAYRTTEPGNDNSGES
jgi:hypothetical protein